MFNRVWPLFLLVTILGPKLPAVETEAIAVVDCHVHLWDVQRPDGLTWLKPDNKTLYRNILPQDFDPLAKANGVKAVVVVQAGQSIPDNQWNLDITASNKGLYRGVVGNLSQIIGTPEFAPMFEKLAADKRYVGYRLSGRSPGKLTDKFFADLQLTADKKKTVDFLCGEYSLDDVAEIAARVPKLKIIIDHFGNVELNELPLDEAWIKRFRAVAQHKNVFCKVSALYGRVKKQPAPRELKFYEPILDLAWECYGEDRLIYGSDWPVSETTADYASVLQLTKTYFQGKGRSVSEKVFSKNAVLFYGISGFD